MCQSDGVMKIGNKEAGDKDVMNNDDDEKPPSKGKERNSRVIVFSRFIHFLPGCRVVSMI